MILKIQIIVPEFTIPEKFEDDRSISNIIFLLKKQNWIKSYYIRRVYIGNKIVIYIFPMLSSRIFYSNKLRQVVSRLTDFIGCIRPYKLVVEVNCNITFITKILLI